MNVSIFYDTPKYVNQFQMFIESKKELFHSFTYEYIPLEKEIPTKDSISIFLLNSQRANSSHLTNTIQRLKQLGAHDKSMIFVINDIEKISNEEVAIVYKDLEKKLSRLIEDPKILFVSLTGYEVMQRYKSEGVVSTFLFSNHKDGAVKTFQQILHERNIQLLIEYSGVQKLEEAIKKLLKKEFLAIKRDPSKKYIFAYRLDPLFLRELQKDISLFIQVIDTEDDLEFLREEVEAIVVTSRYFYEITEDNLNSYRNMILLVDGSNQIQLFEMEKAIRKWKRKFPDTLFIPVNSYPLSKLDNIVTEELIKDKDIVIVDDNGFPLPKTTIKNWKNVLFKSSGIDVVKNVLLQRREEIFV